MFELLTLKASEVSDFERECVLTVDEMSITLGVELNMVTGKLHGNVTIPGHTGQGTHGLVFMLAGVTMRWKQVVAYHFTGNSSNGAMYKPVIPEIVQRGSINWVTCIVCHH